MAAGVGAKRTKTPGGGETRGGEAEGGEAGRRGGGEAGRRRGMRWGSHRLRVRGGAGLGDPDFG